MEKISFIIPCYRSEKTIRGVIDEIIEEVNKLGYQYEIICVDDCSPDDVYKVLEEKCRNNFNIKVVRFAKNFGQHAGMIAGIRFATGDYMVFLDDDGQCPIENLNDMIEPLSKSWDVSIARYRKKKQSAFKNLGSWFHETVANHLIDKPKNIQMSNFIAMKRFVAEEIVKYEGPYPHISGLLFRSSIKIVNVQMEEKSRKEGESTYSIRKLVGLWMNSFTAFSIKPLRFAAFLGIAFAAIGFVNGTVLVIRKLAGFPNALGWSSLMVVMLIIGGMILFVLGIMGEYIGRIYMSVNNTPQYVIRDVKNIGKKEKEE